MRCGRHRCAALTLVAPTGVGAWSPRRVVSAAGHGRRGVLRRCLGAALAVSTCRSGEALVPTGATASRLQWSAAAHLWWWADWPGGCRDDPKARAGETRTLAVWFAGPRLVPMDGSRQPWRDRSECAMRGLTRSAPSPSRRRRPRPRILRERRVRDLDAASGCSGVVPNVGTNVSLHTVAYVDACRWETPRRQRDQRTAPRGAVDGDG